MVKITISVDKSFSEKIVFIKALRSDLGIGLKEAKELSERIIDSTVPIALEVNDPNFAAHIKGVIVDWSENINHNALYEDLKTFFDSAIEIERDTGTSENTKFLEALLTLTELHFRGSGGYAE